MGRMRSTPSDRVGSLKKTASEDAVRIACRPSVFLDRLPGRRIDARAQFLARLEMRHPFFRHHHLVARLRIASDARRSAVQRKAAETADLDALAGHQGYRLRIEDGIDSEIRVH